jgi:hypothetical protein
LSGCARRFWNVTRASPSACFCLGLERGHSLPAVLDQLQEARHDEGEQRAASFCVAHAQSRVKATPVIASNCTLRLSAPLMTSASATCECSASAGNHGKLAVGTLGQCGEGDREAGGVPPAANTARCRRRLLALVGRRLPPRLVAVASEGFITGAPKVVLPVTW